MLNQREMDEIKIAAEARIRELTEEFMRLFFEPYEEEPIVPEQMTEVQDG